MTQSPRLSNSTSQTTKQPRTRNVSLLLFATALDTTWRAFVPTLGGTFLGIGIDQWFHTAPFGVIICLAAGAVLSGFLIFDQIRRARKDG